MGNRGAGRAYSEGMRVWIQAIVILMAAVPVRGQGPLLRLDEPTVRIVVTVGPEAPDEPRAGMLGELQGVIAVLDRADIAKLLACEPKKPAVVGRPPEGETVCFIHIVGEKAAKVCEVVRGLDGRIVVEEMGAGEERPRRGGCCRRRFSRSLALEASRVRSLALRKGFCRVSCSSAPSRGMLLGHRLPPRCHRWRWPACRRS